MADARARSCEVIRLLSTRGWMWGLFVGFSTLIVLGWSELPLWVLLVSSFFALLGAVAVIGLGSIYVSSDAVWTQTLTGRYGMRWSEVTLVEFNSLGIVFHGDGKRLVIVGPELWSENERNIGIAFLNARLTESKIQVKRSARADFMLTKNARFKVPDA
jgi:hypothetical protein